MLGVADDALEEFAPLVSHMQRWLLQLDAPRHAQLRRLMNPGFAPPAVERLRPEIEAIIDRLLNEMEDSSEPDIIRHLAYPLPVQVISEMLDLPHELRRRCTELSNDIANWFGNVLRTPERARAAQRAIAELDRLFRRAGTRAQTAAKGRPPEPPRSAPANAASDCPTKTCMRNASCCCSPAMKRLDI